MPLSPDGAKKRLRFSWLRFARASGARRDFAARARSIGSRDDDRNRFQRQLANLVDLLHEDQLQLLTDGLRDVDDVLAVPLRQDDALDAGPVGRQHLLLDPA